MLKGALGDDTFVIGDLSFRLIDGGPGLDTLSLETWDLVLDLRQTGGHRLRSLEIIDLTGMGDNAVVLDRVTVINLSDETNTLKIHGDPGDIAAIGSSWTLEPPVSEGGITYRVYSWGQTRARLLIEETVQIRGFL